MKARDAPTETPSLRRVATRAMFGAVYVAALGWLALASPLRARADRYDVKAYDLLPRAYQPVVVQALPWAAATWTHDPFETASAGAAPPPSRAASATRPTTAPVVSYLTVFRDVHELRVLVRHADGHLAAYAPGSRIGARTLRTIDGCNLVFDDGSHTTIEACAG